MGFRVQRKVSPRVTSHPPKVPYTLQIYTFFNHVVNPSPLLARGSVVPRRLSNWFFPVSLVLPWRPAGCPIDPFLPPWCLASCPISPFLPPVPPWCLSGCPIDPFLPPWCFPVKGNPALSLCYGQPAVGPTRIYREPGRSPLKLY